MSSTEPTATTPTAGETSGTPPPAAATSEMNAVPAGDASKEKTASKVPGGPESPSPEKTGSKPSGKGSRRTPSMARTEAPKEDKDKEGDGEGSDGKEGSDAESEYETICIRRKKPTPFFQRLKRFLSNYLSFDIYMSSVMWEAFKLLVITSQFNWALEILDGVLHIMVAAGKCALKKQCVTGARSRRKSDSPETDAEKTPEPDKKSSMKSTASKPSAKPAGSMAKSASKAGPGSSEPPTSSATGESGEAKATSEGPTTETTSAEGAEPTSAAAASPTSSP